MDGTVSRVAPELVACIREARYPTVHEVTRLADRIRMEVYGGASAFAWSATRDDDAERILSFRFAQAALVGDVVVMASTPVPAVIEQVFPIPV